MVNGQPSDPRRKAFVEPEFAPPVHGHKVAEPLMREFSSVLAGDCKWLLDLGFTMGYDVCDANFV